MIIIKTKPYNTPSYQAVYEFESSFPETLVRVPEYFSNPIGKKISNIVVQKYSTFLKNRLKKNRSNTLFFVLMNICDMYKILPYYNNFQSIAIYIYDIWPKDYHLLNKMSENLNITHIFFSSLYTKNFFQEHYKNNIKFYWLPEAVKPEEYLTTEYE